MRKMMLGLVMVVMMFAMVGCGEETKKGFVPEQVTQTPSGNTEEVLDEEIKKDIEEVANGDLTQYYDVEKYVGTPTIKTMICLYYDTRDAYGFVNKDDIFEGTLYVEYDERLEDGKGYECIVCDNDTPDNKKDDVIAYIFTE
jgi:hypothetical protein